MLKTQFQSKQKQSPALKYKLSDLILEENRQANNLNNSLQNNSSQQNTHRPPKISNKNFIISRTRSKTETKPPQKSNSKQKIPPIQQQSRNGNKLQSLLAKHSNLPIESDLKQLQKNEQNIKSNLLNSSSINLRELQNTSNQKTMPNLEKKISTKEFKLFITDNIQSDIDDSSESDLNKLKNSENYGEKIYQSINNNQLYQKSFKKIKSSNKKKSLYQQQQPKKVSYSNFLKDFGATKEQNQKSVQKSQDLCNNNFIVAQIKHEETSKNLMLKKMDTEIFLPEQDVFQQQVKKNSFVCNINCSSYRPRQLRRVSRSITNSKAENFDSRQGSIYESCQSTERKKIFQQSLNLDLPKKSLNFKKNTQRSQEKLSIPRPRKLSNHQYSSNSKFQSLQKSYQSQCSSNQITRRVQQCINKILTNENSNNNNMSSLGLQTSKPVEEFIKIESKYNSEQIPLQSSKICNNIDYTSSFNQDYSQQFSSKYSNIENLSNTKDIKIINSSSNNINNNNNISSNQQQQKTNSSFKKIIKKPKKWIDDKENFQKYDGQNNSNNKNKLNPQKQLDALINNINLDNINLKDQYKQNQKQLDSNRDFDDLRKYYEQKYDNNLKQQQLQQQANNNNKNQRKHRLYSNF